ncbi:Uncharacterised protein [Candidatus Bilamarchaeum dharawalense]|uniref:Uncharacterized protein n=1 Tax=Candidatus Bilamarchaeum dharawalense TaxID=2885759 RepID=A0A5E4LQL6_9ARCH|nr:Uncharacterised protein [Candidatus Bilamarchaeum dharawalense]
MFLNRAVTAITLVGGILAVIISLVYGSPLLSVVAACFFFLSLVLWKYGYLIIPFFTKATNIIEMHDGYEVPPSREYIIKKNESGYYVSKFLEIKFYESSMDKGTEEKKNMFESFEKAVSSLKYIVKISLMISTLDLSKHIDEIKTKRGAVESRKAKEVKLAADESMRIDRELAYWNRLLDRITQGERPVEIIAFASTTAFGLTREEAVSRVSRQAKELKTILSSSLGCDIRELHDLEMLKCFEWDYFFPTTPEEIKDALF